MNFKKFVLENLNEDFGSSITPPTENEKKSMQALFNTWYNIATDKIENHMPLDIVETVVRYLEKCGYIKGEEENNKE